MKERSFTNENNPGHILIRIYNRTKLGKLHIYTAHFDFSTAQIVINCTLKYALNQP